MCSLDPLICLDLHDQRMYFLSKFERDIQLVFSEISEKRNINNLMVKNYLKKVNIFLSGDFYILLRSSEGCLFLNYANELIEKFKHISYLLRVDIDSHFFLTFRLNRPFVFKTVFEEVLKYGKTYGMIEKHQTVLVLVHNENLKSFDKMRNTLSAEHVISFLGANYFTVYYNFLDLDVKSVLNSDATGITCTEDCSFHNVYQRLEEKVNNSEWKACCEVHDCLCLDGKAFLNKYGLLVKYGKSINHIKILKGSGLDLLTKTAHIKHLMSKHMPKKPDYILHIISNSQKVIIYQSCILLQMLDDVNVDHIFIVNQNTSTKNKPDISLMEFLNAQKEEIQNAMIHKYNLDISRDKLWLPCIDILLDSAVKFSFLTVSSNTTLRLHVPNSGSNSGKNPGIFVQYNFARLSNLFNNFDLKVKEGYYDPLPSLEEINFKLLEVEEEWHLFTYVLSFPNVVQDIINSITNKYPLKSCFPINKICIILSELCHHLSIYYSRVRILGGPQPQLQKIMHARLWLLKAIYHILNNCLLLLNIQGLEQM